ncbi:hypothetical protein CR161_09860 [Prosthecochloris sp. ZM]|uniref:DUF3298 domain-containing protein n=1 Tax=Prosthecochloris sp. ZM TaxID=2283143 RepID=UPI000DF730F1|nr:DUF3298 domain-containing protein [Prosthecochloris sp. ZM]RDD30977.1 hypothetical protein CR161_09860 [Prosthecochloris sp. ZM]
MSENRPSIPAEIRRAVLVEAGHRCAIHTCKQITTEIHHIIPYEKCKAHEFENLIALCPNCHARVHKGEIDAKSLTLYKKYLSLPNDNNRESIVSIFRKQEDSEAEELKEENAVFDFVFSVPTFKSHDIEELSIIMKAHAVEALHWARQHFHKEDCRDEIINELKGGFSIAYINEKFISIECLTYIYSGGAHGQHDVSTLNYKRNPMIGLELEDIFVGGSNYLDFISSYSREYLRKTFGNDVNAKWLNDGTSPKEKNFSNFTFTEHGLKFVFNEYQIASYADGISHVLIPYEHIGDILNQRVLS